HPGPSEAALTGADPSREVAAHPRPVPVHPNLLQLREPVACGGCMRSRPCRYLLNPSAGSRASACASGARVNVLGPWLATPHPGGAVSHLVAQLHGFS